MATGSELDAVIASIIKAKGASVVVQGGKIEPCPRIPTGIFALDLATGGGIPMGRITEIYGAESSGKTSVCLKLIAYTQNILKKKAVFIDAENALDFEWAKRLGVNVEELLVLYPDSAEHAIDMVEAVLYAEDVGIVIIDSIAALTPQNEITSGSEKQIVGGASALVGKMIRKCVSALNEEKKRNHLPALVCINQIRLKIGVMFADPECLHADTLINFVDGRSIPIRKVVEEKIEGPVWSFDETTGKFVAANITEYYYNGRAKDGEFITLVSKGVDTKNGVLSATTSYTHNYLTDTGWKKAIELTIKDKLVTRYKSVVSGLYLEFMNGLLCGDVTVCHKGNSAYLKLQDKANIPYVTWKASVIAQCFHTNKDSGSKYITSQYYEIEELSSHFPNRHPSKMLSNFSWLSFAIWVMDDGYYGRKKYTISLGRFKDNQEVQKQISMLLLKQGLEHSWNRKNLVFKTKSSLIIADNIKTYVHPSMAYKLPETHQGEFSLVFPKPSVTYKKTYSEILSVGSASDRKYRDRGYYDLEIENTHNYMCGNMDNGFVVHNTTPGGNGPRFAYSLRLRLYAKDNFVKAVSDELPTFRTVSGIIKKWKVPVVARNFEYDFCLVPHDNIGLGESPSWNTVASKLKEFGILEKDGKLGWKLEGANFKTLDMIASIYDENKEYRYHLQSLVFTAVMTHMMAPQITEGKTAGYVDMSTGELLNA